MAHNPAKETTRSMLEKTLLTALVEVQEIAQHECDYLKRSGMMQGNYRVIAQVAKTAIAKASRP